MSCCPPVVQVAAFWGVVQHDDVIQKTGFATMTTLIGGNPAPLSVVGAKTPVGTLGINLAGKGSGGSSPYWYYWDFGDGTSSTQQSPSHTYAGSGTYSVAFAVVDAVGRGATATLSVTLTGGATPLSATASATPAAGDSPAAIKLTGSASGGIAPYSYAWTFGDGTTGSGATPSHTYAAAGSYIATLTVTDATAQTKTAQVTGVVSPALSVGAAASPPAGEVGVSVGVTATPGGGPAPYPYSWHFADGSPASPKHNSSHAHASASQL